MGENLYILRLLIYQPQAHYRVPFSYQRRHTYPLPPYSTVLGFLCNLLGIDNLNSTQFRFLRQTKMSIAASFQAKTTEYTWLRNLVADAHSKRFGTTANRCLNGKPEHIGGQSPVLVDVLEEVHLVIYLAHSCEEFLHDICEAILNPTQRLDVIHLGRAEDSIAIMEKPEVIPMSSLKVKREDGQFNHFFWIPKNMFLPCSSTKLSSFHEFDGISYRLPTFWEYSQEGNRHSIRTFEYAVAKLSDGCFVEKRFLFDEQMRLPVFLAELEEQQDGKKRERVGMGEEPIDR